MKAKTIRLSGELAVTTTNGSLFAVFAYDDDQGEVHQNIRAGSVTLDEFEAAELASFICKWLGDCDMCQDLRLDISRLEGEARGRAGL